MPKEEGVEVEGVVIEAVRNGFRVQINNQDNDFIVVATLSGKLRQHYIRIVPGDKVRVIVSPYDMTRGRITYRLKE